MKPITELALVLATAIIWNSVFGLRLPSGNIQLQNGALAWNNRGTNKNRKKNSGSGLAHFGLI